MAELIDEVLISLRRIMRATSIHSRKLRRSVGLTTPQVLVLHTVAEGTRPTATDLARTVSLSQATITTILDELERRELVCRERSETDRRRVHVVLAENGRTALEAAPAPLQDGFEARFAALPSWEQHQLIAALQRVALMMDAEDLDAAPMLSEDAELS